MGLLILDDSVKNRIKAVIEYAAARPTSLEELKETIEGKRKAIGNLDSNHTAYIYEGFRVVYSEEYQKNGLFRHLSISIDLEDRYPAPAACQLIIEEFGFKNRIPLNPNLPKVNEDFYVWIDEINRAVNFLEKK